MNNPQLNKNGELQHLLTTEGLSVAILLNILDTAESFVGVTERDVKKVPLLRGKSDSLILRTQHAPHTLKSRQNGCLPTSSISTLPFPRKAKGETLLDTVNNLCDARRHVRGRHSQSGAAPLIARHVRPRSCHKPETAVMRSYTGVLDAFTIRRYKPTFVIVE